MAKEESAYAQNAEELKGGKPAGPEHDGSFHAPDFFDPKTGKRIETPWDSPGQAEAAVADGTDEKGKMVVDRQPNPTQPVKK
jgi:hypothetical protein